MAEHAVSDPKLLAKIPEGVGFEEASSLPRAALTAWQAVMVKGRGEVREGRGAGGERCGREIRC